ncbi:DNA-directed RNA polymerase subunit alpha [Mycoplasma miroungirhinis]|uniref:DNA-directed RNA polymerase subunit alpha n=1 Tax=Mycoplasma miroungirhinis TaxID=754516 RepID=A0A6M4JHT8_9MOLU|nr:DNA-directed RNA polymerase subunit alpha [Mycoplasma miroungirhinis]QJR43991.1 DNA-directed RNA polymerase subunit alpha [Mycoplasma miroungirhinis]
MEKMTKIHYAELTTEKINEFDSTFSLQPLSRGFADTLGTALRRTLLSSITSCSIFAIKIANVHHEFEILSGIREDIVTLLSNLRHIRFKYIPELFDQPNTVIKVSFNFSGKKIIYAGDIQSDILEIVNTDLYIAEIEEGGQLQVDLFIKSGRGYVDFEENKKIVATLGSKLDSKITNGQILTVDSDFSPVKKISYEVKELNSSSTIIEEELILRVAVDGTIVAAEALSQASQILIAHLQIIGNVDNIQEIRLFEDVAQEKENNQMRSMDIEKLGLTIRSKNALHRAGYYKVDDLLNLTEDELSNIKNLGKKSVDDIVKKINTFRENLNKGDE